MRRINHIVIILFLFISSGVALAQVPILAYYENASGGLKIRYSSGKEINSSELSFGDEIPVGSTIITKHGDFVEIELRNGSIIRINENTNFTIASIQGVNGAAESVFEMYIGKFRTIAAKATGDERYTFKTRTAVCGIRGTDSGMEAVYNEAVAGNIGAKIFVFDGVVDVTKNLTLKIGKRGFSSVEKSMVKLNSKSVSFFGDMAMFENDTRSATITTFSDCLLFEIKRQDFEKLCIKNPELGYKLIKEIAVTLCQRIRKGNQDILKLTTALSIALSK